MADYLAGKVVIVIGLGDEAQRAVAVALAQAGADVAVAGSAADLAAEAALHSIANEVWALGRRSLVATLADADAPAFAAALASVTAELGRLDLILRCDPVRLA
jgi:NAD(P)-dependent dehydrogenase (short-subunit alcohol dehydrogenase family)